MGHRQCHLPVPKLSMRQLGQRGACGSILFPVTNDPWQTVGHLGKDLPALSGLMFVHSENTFPE